MAEITVKVVDQTANKMVTAKLPGAVPMSKLLPALIKKVGLPEGTYYKGQHKESGKELSNDDTLEGANFKDGDTLRLLPSVTAG